MRTRNLRRACVPSQQETSLPEEHLRFMLSMMNRKPESFTKIELAPQKNLAQECAGLNFPQDPQLEKLLSFRKK